MTDEQIEKLRLEIRRGIIVLAVLSQMDTARYGYSLIQRQAVETGCQGTHQSVELCAIGFLGKKRIL